MHGITGAGIYGTHGLAFGHGPLWASAEFWIAVFTAVLTGSTVLLWLETRRLAKGADIQAIDAARINAMNLRAYLSAKPTHFLYFDKLITEFDGRPVTLVFELENMGKTPAYDVAVKINWHPMPARADLPAGFGYPDKSREPAIGAYFVDSRSTVAPFKTAQHTMTLNAEENANLVRAQRCEISYYIYGHVDYIDVFKQPQSTPFCYLFDSQNRPGMIPFTNYREHNTPS